MIAAINAGIVVKVNLLKAGRVCKTLFGKVQIYKYAKRAVQNEQDQGSLLLSLTILMRNFPLFAKMLNQLFLNAFIIPVKPEQKEKSKYVSL